MEKIFYPLFFVLVFTSTLKFSNQTKRLSLTFDKMITIKNEWKFVNGYNERDSSIHYITYFNDYSIYKMPEYYQKWDRYGNMLSNYISNSYFVSRKGYKMGFFYDSLQIVSGIKMNADSFLRSRYLIGNFKMNDTSTNLILQRTDSFNLSGEIQFRKVFATKWKKNVNYPDTICFWFNPSWRALEYSFSKHLDSINQAKLFRIERILVKKNSTESKQTIPGYTNTTEIYVIPEKDSVALLQMIQRSPFQMPE